MRIKRITTKVLERDMGGALFNPSRRWSTKTMVLVFVEGDDGNCGLGEVWTSGGAAAPLVATIEQDIAIQVVDTDPHAFAGLWHDIYRSTDHSSRPGIVTACLGAVDMAVWDLLAKHHKMPLYRYLGACRETVPCYASAGLYGDGKTADDLAAEMASYIDQGFSGVKMKIGALALAEDLERVAKARQAIGPAHALMIDAVYSLDVPTALRLARTVAPHDIYWFEAPVSPRDVAGQAIVNRDGPIPVCGNEGEFGLEGFRDLIVQRAVEFVQFDLAVCGGITGARRIADLAAAFHLPCTLHAASTSILLASTLHVAAAMANCQSVEFHMLHRWLFELAPKDAFAVVDGCVQPPAGPGIGIELSPNMV